MIFMRSTLTLAQSQKPPMIVPDENNAQDIANNGSLLNDYMHPDMHNIKY